MAFYHQSVLIFVLLIRWCYATGDIFDAVLYRTHLLDSMNVQKLRELMRDGNILDARKPLSSSSKQKPNIDPMVAFTDSSLPSVPYELNVLYDHDTAPDFELKLTQYGIKFHTTDELNNLNNNNNNNGGYHHIQSSNEESGDVKVTRINLSTFTQYPNVKPLAISKSHYQHLAFTSWWKSNKSRRNWRFVRPHPHICTFHS
jgi:hypothetical protein